MPIPVYGRSYRQSASGTSPEFGRLLAGANLGGDTLADAQGRQLSMYDAYGQMASGQGPSLGREQLKQGLSQSQANAMALAGQTRGGNLAGAQQAAMAAQTGQAMQANADAAALTAQEQQAAMAAQAGIAGQLAGQGLESQMGYEQLLTGANLAQMQAQLEHELGTRELREREKQGRHGRIQDWIKTGSNVVGSILSAIFASDERVKTNVRPGGLAATQAVAEADPIAFNYQPGFGPHGQQIGVTAQSLERTPAGAQVVRTDPNTGVKMVDSRGLSALNTAALADIVPRIESLETQLGGKGSLRAVPATQPRNLQYEPDDATAFAGGPGNSASRLADEIRAARLARIARPAMLAEARDAGLGRAKPGLRIDSDRYQSGGSALANIRDMRQRFDAADTRKDKGQAAGGLLAGLFSNIGGGG